MKLDRSSLWWLLAIAVAVLFLVVVVLDPGARLGREEYIKRAIGRWERDNK